MPFVTNTNYSDFEATWAGTLYQFPSKEPVEVPAEVVQNVFGWGDDNKEPYLVRLGWIKFASDLADGIKRLNKFVITEAKPQEVEDNGVVALPIQRRRRV
jgi:hypothetical protein